MTTKTKKAKYFGYNHNGTLLGEYATKKEADKDVAEYIFQTGNAAYVATEKQ